MFRQLTAIFRGLHVPRKLLQYCLRLGWMWIVVLSVWPAAVESTVAGQNIPDYRVKVINLATKRV
jgi:hypothetical protein